MASQAGIIPFGYERDADVVRTLNRPGVYMLETRTPGRPSRLYVGVSETVADRLEGHKDETTWTRALGFVGSQSSMTRDHFAYIESVLIEMAKGSDGFVVENAVQPSMPPLLPADEREVHRQMGCLLRAAKYLGIDLGTCPPASRSTLLESGLNTAYDERLEDLSDLEILIWLNAQLGVRIRYIVSYAADPGLCHRGRYLRGSRDLEKPQAPGGLQKTHRPRYPRVHQNRTGQDSRTCGAGVRHIQPAGQSRAASPGPGQCSGGVSSYQSPCRLSSYPGRRAQATQKGQPNVHRPT